MAAKMEREFIMVGGPETGGWPRVRWVTQRQVGGPESGGWPRRRCWTRDCWETWMSDT